MAKPASSATSAVFVPPSKSAANARHLSGTSCIRSVRGFVRSFFNHFPVHAVDAPRNSKLFSVHFECYHSCGPRALSSSVAGFYP